MRRLLLLVSAVVLVDTMFFSALAPLLPHYRDTFGLTKASAGILSGAFALGTVVGALPSALLVARVGVKRAVIVGLAVIAVTSVAFGLSHDLWLLDTTRLFQGIGSAFAWTGGLAWLIDVAPRERRGELLGIAIGSAIGGALLGPVLGGIALYAGSRATFSGVAVLAALLAAAAAAMSTPPAMEHQPLSALPRALRNPRVLGGIWLVLLPGMLFGVMWVLAPLKLSALGVGTIGIPAVFLVSAALQSVENPFAGRWSDRRGPLAPLRVGLLASTVVTAMLPWANERWLFAALVIACSMTYGLFGTPAMAMLADGAEEAGLDHSLGFSLMNLAWGPGTIVGATVGGALAGATSDAVPWIGAAVLVVVSFAVTARMRSLRPGAVAI